jgi:hypothetical protein
VPSRKSPPSSAGIPPFRSPTANDRGAMMMISSVVDPNWPLTNPDEARLFRHFVEQLARWVRRPIRWPKSRRQVANARGSAGLV